MAQKKTTKKKKAAKKQAKRAKAAKKPRAAEFKAPRPGDVPPRAGWYLGPMEGVTLDNPEEDVYRITLFDDNDHAVAAAYSASERECYLRAQAIYFELAPKGK